MTFSPFYLGNDVQPDTENGYVINQNWGAQINFMVPLDRESVRQCKRNAKRVEEKMKLDFEIVRSLKCAELQQKGFTYRPGSRVEHLCSDIVPISSLIKKPDPPKTPKKKFGLF